MRRLDLLELIALDAIPSGLQAVVNDLLAAQIGAATDGAEPDLVDVLAAAGGPLKALQQQQALADAACLVGFLDPRLVPTPEDVTDPEHELALAEIDRADRLRYWEWCQGADATAALAPAFPEAAAAPAAGPPGESLRDTSVDLPLRAAAGARR